MADSYIQAVAEGFVVWFRCDSVVRNDEIQFTNKECETINSFLLLILFWQYMGLRLKKATISQPPPPNQSTEHRRRDAPSFGKYQEVWHMMYSRPKEHTLRSCRIRGIRSLEEVRSMNRWWTNLTLYGINADKGTRPSKLINNKAKNIQR